MGDQSSFDLLFGIEFVTGVVAVVFKFGAVLYSESCDYHNFSLLQSWTSCQFHHWSFLVKIHPCMTALSCSVPSDGDPDTQ